MFFKMLKSDLKRKKGLNVILFIPLGFFLPMLFMRYDKIGKVALTGFFISLSVEIFQMFDCGSSDINDLITNTAGACLGFLIYKLISKVVPERSTTVFHAESIQEYIEIAFYWIYSLVVMITIQPIIFHALF